MSKEVNKSALHVQAGVEQPPAVRNDIIERIKAKKIKKVLADDLVSGIKNKNISLLSKAITLVESTLQHDQEVAQEVIEKCLSEAGKSIRIGITGVPGVGKSSFIDTFGTLLCKLGKKVAVLAIDPSSERSKGSILGDKTRMEQLIVEKNAFIRPSPSAGSLGGVAQKTRESIILCEAAGFDVIIVETVGVGQSETTVHSMVDFFLLLMLAGAGDELQGIKRGIMEMCDAIFINKADGDNINAATRAKAEYKSALHLFPPSPSNWVATADTCSALTGDGIEEVWNRILEYVSLTKENQYFDTRRQEQEITRFYQHIEEGIKSRFYAKNNIKDRIVSQEADITNNKVSVYKAAQKILDQAYDS